jgi:hypothetical protein
MTNASTVHSAAHNPCTSSPPNHPPPPQVWVAPGSRVILAADAHAVDHLGYDPSGLVGQPFSRMGPDIAALEE